MDLKTARVLFLLANCLLGGCNSIDLTIVDSEGPTWLTGKTWGIRLYITGMDLGMFFTTHKITQASTQSPKGLEIFSHCQMSASDTHVGQGPSLLLLPATPLRVYNLLDKTL